VEDRTLSLLDVADLWAISRQRAHQILRGVTPALPGRGRPGGGARYSPEQLADVARAHRDAAAREADKWTERLRSVGGG
jgi:hypothetical protein